MGPLERRGKGRAVRRGGRRLRGAPGRSRRPPGALTAGVPAAVLAAGALFTFPGPVSGQEVRLAGEPRSEAQETLRRFLDAERFTLWVRDTVISRADTVRGPVLLLEGTARIAGRVEGDLYVVDGDLFLRSGASIAGDILVLGGGFYDSGLADVRGGITYRPNEPLRVRPTEGRFEIISEVEPEPAFELAGTYGFRLPAYDRVSGLSIPVGALGRLSGAPGRPELAAGLTWIPARGDVDYRLHNSWRLGERLRLGLYATTAVVSNEEWIRPTWYNSLAHFVAGDDARGHYDSRAFGLELEWTSPEPPVWEEAPRWRVVVSGGREEAEPLRARDVTILFGDGVGHGRDLIPTLRSLWSARAGFEWALNRRDGRMAFGMGVEGGLQDELWSDCAVRCSYDYVLVEGRVSARRVTGWGHALDAFVIGRADVAGNLPSRRSSTLGGVGTLPTMPPGGLRGSRMLFAEAAYAVPLVGDAALGGVDAFARGSAGGIGSDGEGFDLYGSVQGGLALRLWDFRLEFGAAAGSTADPGDPGVIAFLDIRTARSARPTRMPPPR